MALGGPNHLHRSPARAIRAFVWDLADEGIHEVLDRLAQLGIDGINLALAYHGGRFYCPHNRRHGMVHAPDGALYFQPLLSCYEALRPRVHPEYGSGVFVARAREALHERNMSMTAWVVLFNNLTLSMSYPNVTGVNALGDRIEGALCPANPDVRTYAQALVEDLASRVGVDVIEIEDFSFASHLSYTGPRWIGIPIGPNLGYLLTLCFCQHCRHRAEEANIEIGALKYHVERMVRQGLSGSLSDRRIGDEIADPYNPISRYAETRSETITTLLDELNESIAGTKALIQPILSEHPDEIWRWGVELRALRERFQSVTIPTTCSINATHACLDRYAEILELERGLVADIRLRDAEGEANRSLAGLIDACEGFGIDRFVFSHYGLARLDTLDLIGSLAHH
ncbi:hypothetical protein LLG95_01175 [bacterium]|nr:hypothetical protein [bacterium]